MRVIGVIPARGGSKGLPNKNLLPILGKPLIGYTIEAALCSERLTQTVVSTDSDAIAEAAAAYEVRVIMRPPEMATDTAPIEWALRHATRALMEDGNQPEIVVWLQANLPYRDPEAIDRAVDTLESTGADSVMSVFATQDHYILKKMDDEGRLTPLQPDLKMYRRQDAPVYYQPDGAIFAIRTSVLLATEGQEGMHVFLGKDIRGIVQDRRYAIEIEERMDLQLAELMIRNENQSEGRQ